MLDHQEQIHIMGMTPVEKIKYEDKFEKFNRELPQDTINIFPVLDNDDATMNRRVFPPGMKPNPNFSDRIYLNAMKEAGEEIKFGLTASTNFNDQPSEDIISSTSKRMAGPTVVPQY